MKSEHIFCSASSQKGFFAIMFFNDLLNGILEARRLKYFVFDIVYSEFFFGLDSNFGC